MLISLITLATLHIPFETQRPETVHAPFNPEVEVTAPHFVDPEDSEPFVELSASHSLARLQDTLRPPSIDEVTRGALLQESHHGTAVTEVKSLLDTLGYRTSNHNRYDSQLTRAVGAFQEKHGLTTAGSPYWGKVGPSTLSALRSAVDNNYDPSLGEQLAQYARRRMSGYQGSCYRYVANAIHAKTESFLRGYHAYMAADYLAQSRFFSEIDVRNINELETLPAGAVVVWGKGSSRSGHISIADGNGNEISDHMRPQMLSHYGGASPRVFLPINPRG